MINSSRIGSVTLITALTMAAAPADAAAKCRPSAGVDVRPGVVLIVDGRVVGEYENGDEVSGKFPPRDELFSIAVTCRDVTTPSSPRPTRQNAIIIVTKAGVLPLVETWLADLVDAQRAHLARTGRYAGTASELRVEAPLSLQLQLHATETGWSAETHVSALRVVCAVVDGTELPQRSGQKPGVPFCHPLDG